jgi:hypothetical protein
MLAAQLHDLLEREPLWPVCLVHPFD